MDEKEVREWCNKLGQSVNNFGLNSHECAEYICDHEHRTLQQNIMRFCLAYIQAQAKRVDSRRYDLRNEATVMVAKKIMNNLEPEDLYLPHV